MRAGLLEEAAGALLEGDTSTARVLLREVIDATIGLPALALRMGVRDRSVVRMFGPTGNAAAGKLVAVLAILAEHRDSGNETHRRMPCCADLARNTVMRFAYVLAAASAALTYGAHAQLAQPAISTQMRQAADVVRARWQARAALGQVPASVVEPSITSGKILTPTIDVTKAPGLPSLQLNIARGTVGVASLQITLTSPSGQHSVMTIVSPPSVPSEPANETLTIEMGLNGFFGPNQLGLYAEHGAWTISYILLLSNDSQFVPYNGSTASGLFAGGAVVKVANPGTPDVVAPAVGRGAIVTPTVSLSGPKPYAVLRLPAADKLSGVSSISVALNGPNGTNGFPSQIYAYLNVLAPAASTPGVLYGPLSATQPLGTYTISSIYVCDAAFNCTSYNTPADIAAHFSKMTIDVVQ